MNAVPIKSLLLQSDKGYTSGIYSWGICVLTEARKPEGKYYAFL